MSIRIQTVCNLIHRQLKGTKTMKPGAMILAAACAAQLALGADPLDNWTSNNVRVSTGASLTKASFGNGVFFASGPVYDTSGNFLGGVLYGSPDGVNWTLRSTTKVGLGAPLYGNGIFIAQAGLSTVLSADGINWTPGGTNTGAIAMAYGNGRFVAVRGLPPLISSSPDGANWTSWYWKPQSGVENPAWFSAVAYGNGLFVALGQGINFTAVATSPDGVSWIEYPQAGPNPFQGMVSSMTFGNGVFVAVGGSYLQGMVNQVHGNIWTSTDGVNWYTRMDAANSVAGGPGLTCVGYGGGQFVVGGGVDYTNGSRLISTSPDGTNWTSRPISVALLGVIFGNGQFVGLPGGGSVLRSGVIGKLGASLSLANGVQGTITGVTGQQYAVQTSTNLSSWSLLTNVTINTNGLAQFSDSVSTNFSRRFYGAQLTRP